MGSSNTVELGGSQQNLPNPVNATNISDPTQTTTTPTVSPTQRNALSTYQSNLLLLNNISNVSKPTQKPSSTNSISSKKHTKQTKRKRANQQQLGFQFHRAPPQNRDHHLSDIEEEEHGSPTAKRSFRSFVDAASRSGSYPQGQDNLGENSLFHMFQGAKSQGQFGAICQEKPVHSPTNPVHPRSFEPDQNEYVYGFLSRTTAGGPNNNSLFIARIDQSYIVSGPQVQALNPSLFPGALFRIRRKDVNTSKLHLPSDKIERVTSSLLRALPRSEAAKFPFGYGKLVKDKSSSGLAIRAMEMPNSTALSPVPAGWKPCKHLHFPVVNLDPEALSCWSIGDTVRFRIGISVGNVPIAFDLQAGILLTPHNFIPGTTTHQEPILSSLFACGPVDTHFALGTVTTTISDQALTESIQAGSLSEEQAKRTIYIAQSPPLAAAPNLISMSMIAQIYHQRQQGSWLDSSLDQLSEVLANSSLTNLDLTDGKISLIFQLSDKETNLKIHDMVRRSYNLLCKDGHQRVYRTVVQTAIKPHSRFGNTFPLNSGKHFSWAACDKVMSLATSWTGYELATSLVKHTKNDLGVTVDIITPLSNTHADVVHFVFSDQTQTNLTNSIISGSDLNDSLAFDQQLRLQKQAKGLEVWFRRQPLGNCPITKFLTTFSPAEARMEFSSPKDPNPLYQSVKKVTVFLFQGQKQEQSFSQELTRLGATVMRLADLSHPDTLFLEALPTRPLPPDYFKLARHPGCLGASIVDRFTFAFVCSPEHRNNFMKDAGFIVTESESTPLPLSLAAGPRSPWAAITSSSVTKAIASPQSTPDLVSTDDSAIYISGFSNMYGATWVETFLATNMQLNC